MAIVAHALTTVARVKSRLEIASGTTTWDSLLAELINGATDIIEAYTGRRFKTATYTNEVYSLFEGQKFIYLKAWPVTTLTSVYYRAGSPGTPNWTALTTDEYELEHDGSSGILRLHVALSGTNILRVTYVGGYTIDFTANTLPFAITDICERLVVWQFKKRTDEGKSNDAAGEANVTWSTDDLSKKDREVLERFSRPYFA